MSEALKLNVEALDLFRAEKTSAIARDLRLNLKRVLGEGALEAPEAALTLLATATSVDESELADYARARLRELDFSAEQIQEAEESAALMGMLNMYYRFRHFVSHAPGSDADQAYRTAGLRMTALAKPLLGKERFEMLAFAVSVINGCESCVVSHEKALRQAGVSTDQVHDLARLAAVVKGLASL